MDHFGTFWWPSARFSGKSVNQFFNYGVRVLCAYGSGSGSVHWISIWAWNLSFDLVLGSTSLLVFVVNYVWISLGKFSAPWDFAERCTLQIQIQAKCSFYLLARPQTKIWPSQTWWLLISSKNSFIQWFDMKLSFQIFLLTDVQQWHRCSWSMHPWILRKPADHDCNANLHVCVISLVSAYFYLWILPETLEGEIVV